jgi:hypothetical protein
MFLDARPLKRGRRNAWKISHILAAFLLVQLAHMTLSLTLADLAELIVPDKDKFSDVAG